MKDMFKKLFDLAGTVGQRLKYGMECNGIVEVTMAASQPLKANYGRFVTIDSSGNAALTEATDTTIFGSVEGGSTETTSSTAGADKRMCDIRTDVLYRIPVSSGTYSRATHRGTVSDLVNSTGAQGVAVGTTTRGHLIIVDGDEVNNKWVIAKINPAKQAK